MQTSSRRDFWAIFDTILLCVLVVAMCSQINLRTIGRDTLATEGYATKQFFIALSDVIFLLVFAWFCARTTFLKAWRKIWLPPLPCFALLFVMLISALHSTHIVDVSREALAQSHGLLGTLKTLARTKELQGAAAEIIQFGATFLLAPMLFVNLLFDRRMQNAGFKIQDAENPSEYSERGLVNRTRAAIWAFGAAFVVNALAAAFTKPYPGKGLWGSENIASVYLAIGGAFVLPAALFMQGKIAFREEKTISRTLGLVVVFSVLVMSVPSSSYWAWFFCICAIALVETLLRLSSWRNFFIGLSVFAGLLWIMGGPPFKHLAASYRVSSPTEKVKKQYVEWYAAQGYSRLAQRQFATGVGAGNYQFNIGSYYGGLPNEEKMPPDSNNLYLVQMVSLGALGLGALFWIGADFLKTAWQAARRRILSTQDALLSESNALGAATFAALVAFAFVNIFHAGLVRGMNLVLAFLLSMAVVAWHKNNFQGAKTNVESEISGRADGAEYSDGDDSELRGRRENLH